LGGLFIFKDNFIPASPAIFWISPLNSAALLFLISSPIGEFSQTTPLQLVLSYDSNNFAVRQAS